MTNRQVDPLPEHAMTQALNYFESHSVHGALSDLKAKLISAHDKAEPIVGAADRVAQLEHMLDSVIRRLKRADPMLIAEGALDTIKSQVDNVTSHIASFDGAPDRVKLKNAKSEADKLVRSADSLPRLESELDVDAFTNSIGRLSEVADQKMDALAVRVEETRRTLEDQSAALERARTAVETERARIDTLAAEHQKQFSANQASWQKEFAEGQREREQLASAARSEAKEGFDRDLLVRNERFHDFLAKALGETNSLIAGVEASTRAALDALRADVEKSRKLVGLIAGTGMAGGYQKDADEQRRALNKWNWLTLGGFLGLLAFAVWLFLDPASGGEGGWAVVSARFLVFVAFGLFTTYAGRMAMLCWKSERSHRHKQIALESLPAFLNELPAEQQQAVKLQLAAWFFALRDGHSSGEENSATFPSESLAKLVQAFAGKAGKDG